MPVPMPNGVTEEHLKYLDALRESGETNMFGATPYLMNEFLVSKSEASRILVYWMSSFSERHQKGGEQ